MDVLYTVVVERVENSWHKLSYWVSQFIADENPQESLLPAWLAHASQKGYIQSQEERMRFKEAVEDELDLGYPKQYLPGSSTQAWISSLLLDKREESRNWAFTDLLTFIVTSPVAIADAPAVSGVSDPKLPPSYHQAVEKTSHYGSLYRSLQSHVSWGGTVTGKRKLALRQQRYWQAKACFLSALHGSAVSSTSPYLYTVRCQYGTESMLHDIWHGSHDIQQVLLLSAELMLGWRYDGGEQWLSKLEDRTLLMEQAVEGLYSPVALSSLVNVWGTYFSLSQDLLHVTVIKSS